MAQDTDENTVAKDVKHLQEDKTCRTCQAFYNNSCPHEATALFALGGDQDLFMGCNQHMRAEMIIHMAEQMAAKELIDTVKGA